jgi:hypothetical protein
MMEEVTSFVYGVLLILILYFFLRQLYSVYYTPGSTTLYDSPITQALFPGATKRLFPSWGYNSAGMVKGDPTKYGQGSFWPNSGKGFVARASGSGGPSPSGGMRDHKISTEVELRDGYDPLPLIRDIYDQNAEIPKPVHTEVGWWGM